MSTVSFENILRSGLRVASGGQREPPEEELPLRAELFGGDQMEQHGKTLAASHSVGAGRVRDQLIGRLADNETVLVHTCELLNAAIRDNRRITPAAEWLLDNFYLIEDQVRTAHRHLPAHYS